MSLTVGMRSQTCEGAELPLVAEARHNITNPKQDIWSLPSPRVPHTYRAISLCPTGCGLNMLRRLSGLFLTETLPQEATFYNKGDKMQNYKQLIQNRNSRLNFIEYNIVYLKKKTEKWASKLKTRLVKDEEKGNQWKVNLKRWASFINVNILCSPAVKKQNKIKSFKSQWLISHTLVY